MSNRIAINFENEPTVWQRLVLFIGHHDLRVYVTDRSFVDIGAGSLPSLPCLTMLHEDPAGGSLGSVGRWCEISASAEIMGRGEHDHDQPVNISFSSFRFFARSSPEIGMKPAAAIRIGNGVVISAGAKVLSGVSVGDGAVVAANAIARQDVEPLTIVGGVPARVLRKREPFQPWWNFETSYLVANMVDIQTLARREGGHRWRTERPRIAIKRDGENYVILGFTDGDALRPMSEAPDAMRDYLVQAFGPRPQYWLADCWAD